jgi:predicted enzyme related to lactoylglutathione lyase
MASLPHNITIDCTDAYELAQFWSKVFERPLGDDDFPGDPAALIAMPEGPGVLFLGVPDGKSVKNRVHLDLSPIDRTRDDEVQRLLGVGATLYEDHRKDDGTGWVTLRDPEGNEFCIERGPLDDKS